MKKAEFKEILDLKKVYIQVMFYIQEAPFCLCLKMKHLIGYGNGYACLGTQIIIVGVFQKQKG